LRDYVFDCAPIPTSDIVDGGLADGAAFCDRGPSPSTPDAAADINAYPLGCNVTLPEHAFIKNDTECSEPITCLCQTISAGKASFVCPD
jgi:hypothetical protein